MDIQLHRVEREILTEIETRGYDADNVPFAKGANAKLISLRKGEKTTL